MKCFNDFSIVSKDNVSDEDMKKKTLHKKNQFVDDSNNEVSTSPSQQRKTRSLDNGVTNVNKKYKLDVQKFTKEFS